MALTNPAAVSATSDDTISAPRVPNSAPAAMLAMLIWPASATGRTAHKNTTFSTT